jgi:hypothetical protein
MQARSLKRQIIWQFVLILLPLLTLLFYQTTVDHLRTQATNRTSQYAGRANQAQEQYKRFVDGIVDAAETGVCSSPRITWSISKSRSPC